MLIRISLIIAIIAALAAGVLNVIQVREKITTLVTERNTEHDGRVSAENERDNTKKDLAKANKDLKQTRDDLTTARAEREKAVKEADIQIKKATELSDSLAKANTELKDVQAQLFAFKSTGRSPEQILNFDKMLKQTQEALEASLEEKKILERTVVRVQNRLDIYEHPEKFVTARFDLTGKVLVTDPKWDFVVLDIGEDKGVLENCEFYVKRDGRLVAKIIVRTVQKSQSIANLVPGWKGGEIIEGDQVIPAHPSS